MTKYHINSNGAPAICRAKKGKCPFGEEHEHYSSIEEAQRKSDEINSRENGILNEIKAVKANSPEDQMHIAERLQVYKDYEARTGRLSYASKCLSSEEINDFEPNEETTGHYIEDRKLKNEMIEEQVGVGSLIGTFKINHPVGGRHKDQIVSVYDNGQIKLYDINTKKLITTYIPTKTRLETILLKAGYIPNKEWLNEVEKQKEIFDPKWEPIEAEQRAKASERAQAERGQSPQTPRTLSNRNRYNNIINNSNNSRNSSDNSRKGNSNPQRRNNNSRNPSRNEHNSRNSSPKINASQENTQTNTPREAQRSKLPQYNKHGFRIT